MLMSVSHFFRPAATNSEAETARALRKDPEHGEERVPGIPGTRVRPTRGSGRMGPRMQLCKGCPKCPGLWAPGSNRAPKTEIRTLRPGIRGLRVRIRTPGPGLGTPPNHARGFGSVKLRRRSCFTCLASRAPILEICARNVVQRASDVLGIPLFGQLYNNLNYL